MVTGTMSHSLDPLPRPQSTSHQLSMTKESDGEGEGEGDGEEVPQVYTDLQLSVSRGELVGVTYDHSIIFYEVATFTRQKQVLALTLIQPLSVDTHAIALCVYLKHWENIFNSCLNVEIDYGM